MGVTVLVVDDSAFFRKRVCEILESVPDIKVVGTAANGREAIELTKRLKPDVITMDYEMPVMDGVTAVRHIMQEAPTPILMFSSLSYEGARVTLDALEAGAVDFLPKNFEDIARDASKMQQVLRKRILTIAKPKTAAVAAPQATPEEHAPVSEQKTREQKPVTPQTRSSAPASQPARARSAGASGKRIKHAVDLLAIGTSTGGPIALQKILSRLPANLPVPILLIQHMPATFTPAFAERLNTLSQLTVKHAEDGDILRRGVAYLAPGGKQMLVNGGGAQHQIRILPGDERLTYKPCVDVTFGSAAKSFPGKVLAIVLTGMGADGREGCRMLKRGGSTVWTQSEKSCVIYGMPMAVDKAGYSDESIDISDMADRIVSGLM
ncbi:MAG: chemotaxis response regulator protein-glutamate methylesterase [Oleiphilaceae bacterium]|nr:chemotaxis response regulator protein-glutamate methylesterase [Oleiphilaceae bacterium]